jgi:hypothetical protein
MSLCASCGLEQTDAGGLCRHHLLNQANSWATSNRIMCDFFHRKKIPARLNPEDRDDGCWHAVEAA